MFTMKINCSNYNKQNYFKNEEYHSNLEVVYLACFASYSVLDSVFEMPSLQISAKRCTELTFVDEVNIKAFEIGSIYSSNYASPNGNSDIGVSTWDSSEGNQVNVDASQSGRKLSWMLRISGCIVSWLFLVYFTIPYTQEDLFSMCSSFCFATRAARAG